MSSAPVTEIAKWFREAVRAALKERCLAAADACGGNMTIDDLVSALAMGRMDVDSAKLARSTKTEIGRCAADDVLVALGCFGPEERRAVIGRVTAEIKRIRRVARGERTKEWRRSPSPANIAT